MHFDEQAVCLTGGVGKKNKPATDNFLFMRYMGEMIQKIKSLTCKLFKRADFLSRGKKFIKDHSALQPLAVKMEKSV